MKLDIYKMLQEAKEVNYEKRFFVKLFGDLKLRIDAVRSGYLCTLGAGDRFNFKPISYKVIGVDTWDELQKMLKDKFGTIINTNYEVILNLLNQGLFNGLEVDTILVSNKKLNFHNDYIREWEKV